MRYIAITQPDINNGLGCRVTLWISGCSHHCPGCHNKELWLYNQGKNIKFAYDELKEKVNHDYIKGLTLSGGDPLDQSLTDLKKLKKLLVWYKIIFPEKDIWIYSGFYFKDLQESPLKNEYNEILSLCDVLVDGPYEENKRDITLPFRGSSNQSIIDLKKTFEKGKIINLEIE